jgi:hypothetical protein
MRQHFEERQFTVIKQNIFKLTYRSKCRSIDFYLRSCGTLPGRQTSYTKREADRVIPPSTVSPFLGTFHIN